MNDEATMIEDAIKNNNVILIVKFGSHLYGTNTPTSDTDYKGIFLSEHDDILLINVPKSINFDTNKTSVKNDKDDIDFEMYSLHYFFKLAKQGETVAIDMLHANKASIVYESPLWNKIQQHRAMFYTSNMKSLVGYARKQAAKYGLRGSRLASAKQLKTFFSSQDPASRLKQCWDDIPIDNEHVFLYVNDQDMRTLNFCGKQLQETIKMEYALDIIDRFIEQYGHRARLAETNNGVDWKAMSHAIRAAIQLKEIYETGDLQFPLKEANFLKAVKAGELDFKDVMNALEQHLNDVEKLATTISLPEKVDIKVVDALLLSFIKEYAQ